jgi:hypothetical protein
MRFLTLLTVTGLAALVMGRAASSGRPAVPATPVLVELFTSEGCSSCPPADALLQELDATQPVAGAQLVVLSEHVDYWNYIGWKDPYSSSVFSRRQSEYASRFHLGSVYTPQMVVDGQSEFVGNDSRQASRAIEQARLRQKVSAQISDVMFQAPGSIQARIKVDALPESLRAGSGEVYLVVALNQAESQVLRGENEGRRLRHVAVVQSIARVGTVTKSKGYSGLASARLKSTVGPGNLRVVVFVQEPGSGRVLGAAAQPVAQAR